MDSFADAQDLQDRWRTLTDVETSRAETLLADASAFVRAECPGVDARIEAETLDPLVVKAVVCGMVKRAMLGGTDAAGVASSQQTAGPFSQGFTYVNPTAELYLTRADRRRLGFGGQVAYSVDLAPDAAVPASVW